MPLRMYNAFTDKTDVSHAILGFIACFLIIFPYGWILTFLVTLIFIVYQSLEAESRISSYEDLVEYASGFILALPVVLWLKG